MEVIEMGATQPRDGWGRVCGKFEIRNLKKGCGWEFQNPQSEFKDRQSMQVRLSK
jgi:hypothetical protein